MSFWRIRRTSQSLAGTPAAPAATFRADESVRPAQVCEVFATGDVIREPGLELLVGAGVVRPTDGSCRRRHEPEATALKQRCRTYGRTHGRRWPATCGGLGTGPAGRGAGSRPGDQQADGSAGPR